MPRLIIIVPARQSAGLDDGPVPGGWNEVCPVKIIFAGTPDFAVPPLRVLVESPHEVCAVYTQPDRPAGRGRKLRPSPVKQVALEAGLTVRQPETLRTESEQRSLAALSADLMVVVAYGLLLPKPVLQAPRLGCVNIHASLLPRWRGAAPIQRAILAGDAESGVTLMQMDEGLDTGALLATAATPIGERETAGELHDRLAEMGAALLRESLPALLEGRLAPRPQDDAGATYARKLTKEEALLDWSRSAIELDRAVRAFNPWPVAHTRFRGEVLRVWRSEPVADTVEGEPGTVLAVTGAGVDVATGQGVLRLNEVQPAGGRRMRAADFANSREVIGAVLGRDG
ncbi:MAG: methionyl-tRNA formyltransferase [Gammaproteobacteria bacterium]